MINKALQSPKIIFAGDEKEISTGLLNPLFVLALCIDVFTPLLIWKGVLPSSVRWLSQAAIVLMIVVCAFRMVVGNYIPRAFWLIFAVTVIWSFVAVAGGQGILPTVWGCWLLFQFPLVGLFMYMQPRWPAGFSRLILRIAIAILALEVAVQFIQYIFGETPGDNLAGLFGKNGTGNLVIFIMVLIALFFGHWIAQKKWLSLVAVLVLSMISSVLGEMKFFLAGLIALTGASVIIYPNKSREIGKLILYGLIFFFAMIVFAYSYNRFIPGARRVPLQTYINNPQALLNYLNAAEARYSNNIYHVDLGRNASLAVGWNILKSDPVTFLFGWGIGTRSESVTLGTTGMGLNKGDLGRTTGTGLLIMMQEMGVVGLLVLSGFFIWVILRLFGDIRRNPSSDTNGLRYGVILFTVFWPIWLWYNNAWILRVPMLLYWMLLGYVLWEANQTVVVKSTRRFAKG